MAVLVFGSINFDLIARVPALPGPGETALSPALQTAPGGKGANQALAARLAGGGEVRLVGRVGRDAFAGPALKLLADSGVDISLIARGGASTGVAMIAVSAEGQNQIVAASGANAELTADAVLDAWLAPGTIVLMQMEVPVMASAALATRAAGRGCKIVLNAAPAAPVPKELLDRVDVLVANEHEAPVVARAAGFDADTPVASGRALSAGGARAVVVTLGGEGAVAFKGGKAWHVPALRLDNVVDTTGAGDAFVGALAAALDRGMEWKDALARASVAGSLTCARSGAQPALPMRGEIDAALSRLGRIERADFEIN